MKVKRPTNGSVATLNANAQNGALSSGLISTALPSGVYAIAGLTSNGDGK